jgi:hypothetical protein
MCAIHKCARECDSEIRGIGDCMCHNLNWQKASEKFMDYSLSYQMDVAPAHWRVKQSNKIGNGKDKE